MDQIQITGGVPLKGTIEIAGAKNAALPLMAAGLLTDEPLILSNVPHLADITTMANLLVNIGVTLTLDGQSKESGHTGRVLEIKAEDINTTTAPYDIVRKMRASVVVLGPLLARLGKARVSLPGGCAIGQRPIDLHLKAFEKMGAKILLEDGYVQAEAPKGGLVGGEIIFPKVSVGATENALMAACIANGTSVIKNAAREPEIDDLAHCLNTMGAEVSGIGSDTLTIKGKKKLHGAQYSIIADRIEAGTYAIAAAITGGDITLEGITPDIMDATLEVLHQAGISTESKKNTIRVWAKNGARAKGVNIETAPYPGFATDMQAQLCALMAVADGTSIIKETIFENRFMHIPELMRMGADVTIEGNTAILKGKERLKGAEVMATDLRASVSLVLAGLAAEGQTKINRVYHIDRGYERIEEKLARCGAKISRQRAEAE